MDKEKDLQLRMYNQFKHWLFYEGYVEKKTCNKKKFIEGVRKLTGWNSCITKKSAYSYMYQFMEEVYPDDLFNIEIECQKKIREIDTKKVSYDESFDESILIPF